MGSLIAAEGEVSALTALKKACSADADVLLEGETYDAMMSLVCDGESTVSYKDDATRHTLEASAFELLARLSSGSRKGRKAVMSSGKCNGCVARAMEVIISLLSDEAKEDEAKEDGETDTVEEDGETADDPAESEEAEGLKKP